MSNAVKTVHTSLAPRLTSSICPKLRYGLSGAIGTGEVKVNPLSSERTTSASSSDRSSHATNIRPSPSVTIAGASESPSAFETLTAS